jgi:AraC family transcriptional regulator
MSDTQKPYMTPRRPLDPYRVIRPEQLHNFVPGTVMAEANQATTPQRRIFFRDYRFGPFNAQAPRIDSLILILFNDPSVFVRRRLEEGWQEGDIQRSEIGIVGANHASEWDWMEPQINVSHICLSQELLTSTAASAFDRDYRTIEAIDVLHARDQELRTLGDMLVQEMRTPHGGARLLVDSLTAALSVHLIRRYHRNGKILPIVRNDARLSTAQRTRVLDFIEANLSRNFGLPELADLVDLSETHFGRCFKNAFGDSPHQFVLKRRVQLAIEKICHTKSTFAEIAYATGFADQAHLTHAVKKIAGKTPRELRRA